MGLWDYIDERWKELAEKELRPGFYVAKVANALQSLRRVQIDTEWGAVLDQARRISSPLLDVIPAAGTRMAVLSQDGVPEFPAFIGKIWDDAGTADGMTAWLRANLQEHPGHLELGAEQGIRIKVGANSASITETSTGHIVIESEDGGNLIEIQSNGTVDINADRINLAGEIQKMARADLVKSELDEIRKRLNPMYKNYKRAVDEAKADANSTTAKVKADEDDPTPGTYSVDSPAANKVYGD